MDNTTRDKRHILIADFKRYIRPLEDRNAAGDALNWADYTLATMRNRLLESGEWLEVECDCDNWFVCKNHHDMAERLDIDSLDLLRILAEIQEN